MLKKGLVQGVVKTFSITPEGIISNCGMTSFVVVIHRQFFSTKKLIGILRETKNRWECRVPLTPENIKNLKSKWKDQLEFYVQPSKKRVFPDDQYVQAGSIVQADLSHCDLLMGVKEVPSNLLIPDKKYIFFSHTHKGQVSNIPLLQSVCESGITLHDYELIKDSTNGKRLVAFGKFAGYAGMINAFNGLGDRLLTRGIRTPFVNVPLTQYYQNLKHLKESLKLIGEAIKYQGIPPLVFTFVGSGNVSQGAQEIFNLLPHEWIASKDLKSLTEDKMKSDRIYGCIVKPENYLQKRDGQFDYKEYLEMPELYESNFHESIAPYSTVIINGIYWEPKYPRLLTKNQMKDLQSGSNRLISIADISCDLEGSIEFMNKASTIDEPFYYYDAVNESYSSSDSSNASIQIMSIDNLPSQLPEDSSNHFGSQLQSLIPALVGLTSDVVADKSRITERGELVEEFTNLTEAIKANHRVLVFGSGYVVPPVLDFFSKHPDIIVSVATNELEEAERTLSKYGNPSIIGVDVLKDPELTEKLIQSSDIVISLIGANLHVSLAELCIKHGKSLVTASYISKEMEALNSSAKDAGVLLLNEIGLDPGLDHLAAMEIIEDCRSRGEVIESFVSWCGGLPSPQSISSENPLRYKFSWSPRGVLLAAQNPAQYLKDGNLIEISGEDLLKNHEKVSDLHPVIMFEGIPNRDSLKYKHLYGLDNVKTIFRGTLRYKGFCELMQKFKEYGFLDSKPSSKTPTKYKNWAEFTKTVIGSHSVVIEPEMHRIFDWLGMFDERPLIHTDLFTSNLDGFCRILEKKLKYSNGERDMVFLHHRLVVLNPKTNQKRIIEASLCEFGNEEFSAMARTVGLPVAVAALKILKGELEGVVGVKAPIEGKIYRPILDFLKKQLGIKFQITEKIQ